jgi:hypothetical protein
MFDPYLKHNRKKRLITGIEVEEISLVDKAAACDEYGRSKTFAIVKAAEKSLDESLIEFMALVKDEEADIVDKAGGGDAVKAMEAVKEAIKVLTPYMEVFADDARQAVKLLTAVAAGASASYGKKPDYGYGPAPKSKDDKKFTDGDRLEFYKEGGDMTQFDFMLHGLMNQARENRRRGDPRRDDGYVFKSDEGDDEAGDDAEDHVEKGRSKAVKGQEDNYQEGGDEPQDNFPSFNLPVFPRREVRGGRVI